MNHLPAATPATPVRGRFAPSPTGALHLGNARTALLAWLQARAAGGAFVLRVEDLDSGRVRPGLMETQLDELRWLGLDWDEGPDVGGGYAPYLQSQRLECYEQALQRLAARGLLFACSCSRRDIAQAASAPHAGEEGPRYPGTCRARVVSAGDAPLLALGRGSLALRCRVEPGDTCFDDVLQGRCCADASEEGGDFVVRRRDGAPAYQLAVVVDDAAMRISDVVRGADLLGSTPRQLLLYHALGHAPPRFMHVPLLLGDDGERLAKRHGAVSLGELRTTGVRPERIVGWLAASCGLTETEDAVTPAALIPAFSPARITPTASRVAPDALARLLAE